jgi:hypothetical protein
MAPRNADYSLRQRKHFLIFKFSRAGSDMDGCDLNMKIIKVIPDPLSTHFMRFLNFAMRPNGRIDIFLTYQDEDEEFLDQELI